MKNKKIILGLVGSGKSTLYRKLNEEKVANAVEIELPQICIGNEKLKEQLFELFLKDEDINVIITHPYFLCDNFQDIIKNNEVSVEYEFLEISFTERCKRIKNRSDSIRSDCKIFPSDFLQEEEETLTALKTILSKEIL